MRGRGKDVGGGAISSLNGPGSSSSADGRSGSGTEASLTSSGYEARDSVTANQTRGSLSGNEARNSISGSSARNSISGNEARNSVSGNGATGESGTQATDLTLPMYLSLPPPQGFPIWFSSNQAKHRHGAQAQSFPPYGFPGLWESSHSMSYPCAPQGGRSSRCPEAGPSMLGSNPPQTSGQASSRARGPANDLVLLHHHPFLV